MPTLLNMGCVESVGVAAGNGSSSAEAWRKSANV